MIYTASLWRFIKFVEAENTSGAEGFSSVQTEELQQFNLKNRLDTQADDGTVVIGRAHGRVKVLMKENFTHTENVYCYAHQLNLVLKKV